MAQFAATAGKQPRDQSLFLKPEIPEPRRTRADRLQNDRPGREPRMCQATNATAVPGLKIPLEARQVRSKPIHRARHHLNGQSGEGRTALRKLTT